jgi:hypothetical protein
MVKTMPEHARNLASYEVQAFIDWVTYRWTPEERSAFASEFPVIYNKVVGRTVFTVANVSANCATLEP